MDKAYMFFLSKSLCVFKRMHVEVDPKIMSDEINQLG